MILKSGKLMIYENVFGVIDLNMLEYAYKIYQYNKNILFLFNVVDKKQIDKTKYILTNIIPKEKIIFNFDYKNDIIINYFCNYTFKVKKNVKNFYKLFYGYAHGTWFYSYVNKLKNTTYLAASNYEIEKLRIPNTILGIGKFDEIEYPYHEVDIPRDKPIILFLHTWSKNSKNDPLYYGLSDIKHTSSILEKYTNRFTIVHKNHHITYNYKTNKFITVCSGTYDSRKLIDIADIIIADYGGSAIEAIISDKAKILYVNDDQHERIEKNDLDRMMHDIFHSTSNNDFEKNFLKLIEEPLSNEELKLRKEWRDKLFPNLDKGAKNIANFIKELNSNNYNINDW